MLRLGHKCACWRNRSTVSKNCCYWFRSHAATFDWWERRVQALCLALEAAAGAVACARLTEWMRARARRARKEGEGAAAAEAAAAAVAEAPREPPTAEDVPAEDAPAAAHDPQPTYEEEREELMEKLINRNRVEVQKFDRLTGEMNRVLRSLVFNDRSTVRVALIDRHRTAAKELAVCVHTEGQERTLTTLDAAAAPSSNRFLTDRGVVGRVAILLLKQCLQLGIFDRGLLVVESVFSYFKERVARHERLLERRREHELRRNKGTGFFQSSRHDKVSRIQMVTELVDSHEPTLRASCVLSLGQLRRGQRREPRRIYFR